MKFVSMPQSHLNNMHGYIKKIRSERNKWRRACLQARTNSRLARKEVKLLRLRVGRLDPSWNNLQKELAQ